MFATAKAKIEGTKISLLVMRNGKGGENSTINTCWTPAAGVREVNTYLCAVRDTAVLGDYMIPHITDMGLRVTSSLRYHLVHSFQQNFK